MKKTSVTHPRDPVLDALVSLSAQANMTDMACGYWDRNLNMGLEAIRG